MPIPPCYDILNKVDCPNRTQTCHRTCKLWRDYEIDRDKEYDKRNMAKVVYISAFEKRRIKALKHKQKSLRNKSPEDM